MSAAIPVRALDRAGLVVVERELPEAVDPLDFLERSAAGRGFYFERASERVAIAAYGVVPGTEAADHADEASDVLRVGGFSFDRSRAPSGPWDGFPASAWAVPRVAVRRQGDACVMRAAATFAEGGKRRAEAEIGDALARLARPASRPSETGGTSYRIEPLGTVEAWRRSVEATLDEIRAGRLSKLVLARAARIVAARPWDRFRVVRRLRCAHPAATAFLVSHGDKTFVGATPERLARLDRDRLTTAAIAGTAPPAPVGGSADRAFLSDVKERHEHAIVVDEVRRCLAPFAVDLEACDEPAILSTPTLRHLHTPMAARLRPGAVFSDVCSALHPTPAVCGLPREAARLVLPERESTPRGWYAGGVGWQDGAGGEIVVPLRAALLDGAVATLFAGAGIVEGSHWEAELEETRLKMRVMQAALLEV